MKKQTIATIVCMMMLVPILTTITTAASEPQYGITIAGGRGSIDISIQNNGKEELYNKIVVIRMGISGESFPIAQMNVGEIVHRIYLEVFPKPPKIMGNLIKIEPTEVIICAGDTGAVEAVFHAVIIHILYNNIVLFQR